MDSIKIMEETNSNLIGRAHRNMKQIEVRLQPVLFQEKGRGTPLPQKGRVSLGRLLH